MRACGLALVLLPLSVVFVGPWGARSNTARVALRAGPPGLQKARFFGRWVDWTPVMDEASKAEEGGGDMPLGTLADCESRSL
mmetsp:Transcript_10664/g.12897  ORF Transcript_10664/g.12897 Transcript_10664/m.12897 type:complete len:82 (+) Transcript_10664:90-335(+)